MVRDELVPVLKSLWMKSKTYTECLILHTKLSFLYYLESHREPNTCLKEHYFSYSTTHSQN